MLGYKSLGGKGTNAVLSTVVPIVYRRRTPCCCSSPIRGGIGALSIVIGSESSIYDLEVSPYLLANISSPLLANSRAVHAC
jgi:hypothetical protein